MILTKTDKAPKVSEILGEVGKASDIGKASDMLGEIEEIYEMLGQGANVPEMLGIGVSSNDVFVDTDNDP